MQHRFLSCFFFACCVSCSYLKAGSSSVLDVALTGNTFARESVRTLTLEFEAYEPTTEGENWQRGRYWRDGEKWRVEQDDRSGAGRQYVGVCDGAARKATTYSVVKGQYERSGAINPPGEYQSATDPWSTALMCMPFAGEMRGTLKEIVDRGVAVDKIEKMGNELAIRFRTDKGYYQINLDVTRNYQPAWVAGWGARRSFEGRGEHRVTRFVSPLPGVFFPKKSNITCSKTANRNFTDVRATKISV